jgi:hypothetical protein
MGREDRDIHEAMTDYISSLVRYVSGQIPLTEKEEIFFASLWKVTRVKRKQLLDQPGFVSRYRSHVVSGAFRAYITGNDGQEHTIALAVEGWYIGDPASYFIQEPATFYVEAVEDSIVLQLSYENEQLLLTEIPKFYGFFKTRAERTVASLQVRLLSSLSQTAEERYDQFARKYPELLERFPLYTIASYLGMTREFLSRIRNNKINAKNKVN